MVSRHFQYVSLYDIFRSGFTDEQKLHTVFLEPVMFYTFPSSPSIVCEDRFSILQDGDELYVPFWSLLSILLQNAEVESPESFADLLETIAVTKTGKSVSDYGFLKRFMLDDVYLGLFFRYIWPKIRELALDMPSLFPSHQLPTLGERRRKIEFSRIQVACLVVHQFLGTLDAPAWQDGFQDFHVGYSAEQPHHKAVRAYLTALFEYLRRLTSKEESSPLCEEWPITYSLHICDPERSETHHTKLRPLTVLTLSEASTSPSLLGLPNYADVISANKFIGFGSTGTQEETHVGASPECCPAVLITPPLKDDQALIVTGA